MSAAGAGGILFSGVALAAAVALSASLSAEAFSSLGAHGSTLVAASGGRRGSPMGTSPTALHNRASRRKEKKKKRRTPAFDLDGGDEAPSAAGSARSNAPVLLGGGDAGFADEVPASSQAQIPVAEEPVAEDTRVVGETVTSAASVSDLPLEPGEAIPDVTTVVTDPETGIARIQQGKYVKDKVTGNAVVLSSLGPDYRLAQMFPGVPPDVRERDRVDWASATVPDLVARLRAAATVPLKNTATGKEWRGVPPHPQVSDPAVDFVVANRDLLGFRMKRALGRLKLRAQSQFQKEEALELRALWKHFMLLEDHISAPFRQVVLNAEAVVGPNFGNLDVKSYCGGELYERAANYLVLKTMVAHWEKKYNDALELENIPPDERGVNFYRRLYIGDPKRYLPDPPIIYRLEEVSRIVVMAQKMCKAFVEEPSLFDDLPPELRFTEQALSISGGTELRRFLLEDFCPANNVDGASLREGLRRLHQQMTNMQDDPYGDLTRTLENLFVACDAGTDDARDPYEEYLGGLGTTYETNPGYFQTYTFNHDKNSMVRFLDNIKPMGEGTINAKEVGRQLKGETVEMFGIDFDNLGGGGGRSDDDSETGAQEEKDYVVPQERAAGRPHMMGWLDLLGEDEEDGILDEGTFETDQWEEVNA